MSNTNPKPERWREWEHKHLQAPDGDRTRVVAVLDRTTAECAERARTTLDVPKVIYVGAALQAFLTLSVTDKRAAIEAYRSLHQPAKQKREV